VALFAFFDDYCGHGSIRCAVIYTAHTPAGNRRGYYVVWDVPPGEEDYPHDAFVRTLSGAKTLVESQAPQWAEAYGDAVLAAAAA